MLLQLGQEQLISKAFEQSFVIGLLVILLIVAAFWIRSISKEKNDVQLSKDNIVKESLGIITLVESQLMENKAVNDTAILTRNEILTEIKLLKVVLEKK